MQERQQFLKTGVVTLEKEFGLKIKSSEESREALASVAHLAEFIRARADPARLPG